MQITSGVVTTDGVVFNTTYYDPSIFYGSTIANVPISYGGDLTYTAVSTVVANVPVVYGGDLTYTANSAVVAQVPITISL